MYMHGRGTRGTDEPISERLPAPLALLRLLHRREMSPMTPRVDSLGSASVSSDVTYDG